MHIILAYCSLWYITYLIDVHPIERYLLKLTHPLQCIVIKACPACYRSWENEWCYGCAIQHMIPEWLYECKLWWILRWIIKNNWCQIYAPIKHSLTYAKRLCWNDNWSQWNAILEYTLSHKWMAIWKINRCQWCTICKLIVC